MAGGGQRGGGRVCVCVRFVTAQPAPNLFLISREVWLNKHHHVTFHKKRCCLILVLVEMRLGIFFDLIAPEDK